MSKNNKNKKPPYIHPQVKLIENAGRLLKNFIEDIRHDRAFANRIFYPILYQRKVARQQTSREGKVIDNVIETENEFYLLKSEEYSSPGIILLALLLANGPLVPASKRITLDQFCDKSREKIILARASAFINVISNSNLFTFVFGNLSTTQHGSAVGLEEVRQKFLSLAEGHEKVIRNTHIASDQMISRELRQNQEYLYKMFEHVRDADIKKTLQFIRYMCDSSNIVSEFAYRPVPNELLTNYLDYDVDNEDYLSLMTLQEKIFTTNNYDKIATEQLGSFTQLYYNQIKNALNDEMHSVNHSGLQVYNTKDNNLNNTIKNRLKTSLTRMHQLTKQYLSSALASAIQSSPAQLKQKASSDIVYNIMALMKEYSAMGSEELRDQIYRLASDCNFFLSSCTSKPSLCSLIFEVIKSDVQYFKGLMQTSLRQSISRSNDPITNIQNKIKELSAYADNVDKYFSDSSNFRGPIERGIYKIISQSKAVESIIQQNNEANRAFIEGVNAIISDYLSPVTIQTYANQLYQSIASQQSSSLLGKLTDKLNGMFNNYREIKTIKGFFDSLMKLDACKSNEAIKKECNDVINNIVRFIFVSLKVMVYALAISAAVRQNIIPALNNYAIAYSSLYNSYSGPSNVTETINEINTLANEIINAQKSISELQNKMVKYYEQAVPFTNKTDRDPSQGILPIEYNLLIDAISKIQINFNSQKIATIEASLVKSGNWDNRLESQLMHDYCQFYLAPILQELVTVAIREGAISRTILSNTVISKDLLNLSQILTPNAVSSIVLDANVFNDLAYYTYTFMGDKFITVNPSNVDEVVDYLNKIYNIKSFNFFVIGRNDVYLYMNYAGVPIMYRGAQTKLRKSDLEHAYRWLTDAREGLYKNIKLPRKKPHK